MAGGRARFVALFVCAPLVVEQALAAKADVEFTSSVPFCRKSSEVHELMWPLKDDPSRLVVFGGKGFDWKVTASGPGSKQDHEDELVDEPGKRRMELVQKMIDDEVIKPNVRMFGDVWAFDSSTGTWTEIEHDGLAPIARWKPATAGLMGHRTMILFGGCKDTEITGVLNDLWTFTVLSGEPLRAEWRHIWTARPPARRRGHIAVTNRSHFVVIGGKTWSEDWGTEVLSDVWATPLSTLGLGDDFGRDSGVWTRGSDFPGEPRWGATGTPLGRRDGREVVALFGGRRKDDDAEGGYVYFNDVWIYDFHADEWSDVTPRSGPAPLPRDHHGATSIRGELYIFGGRLSSSYGANDDINDLWSFSLHTGQWVEHKPVDGSPVPKARYMPGFSMSTWKGEKVPTVFGGESLPGSTKTASRNDVWAFVPARGGGHEWKELAPNSCEPDSVEMVEADTLIAMPEIRWAAMYTPAVAAAAVPIGGLLLLVRCWLHSGGGRPVDDAFLVSEGGTEPTLSEYRIFA